MNFQNQQIVQIVNQQNMAYRSQFEQASIDREHMHTCWQNDRLNGNHFALYRRSHHFPLSVNREGSLPLGHTQPIELSQLFPSDQIDVTPNLSPHFSVDLGYGTVLKFSLEKRIE